MNPLADVFISYRRSDAEAHARMLYSDLKRLGYSVFYDIESLGAGDFQASIRRTVESCTDVIVLLSPDALGPRIHNELDFVRREISLALSMNRNVVGIFIGDCHSFPKDLPEDIAAISRVNCLTARMEYYDAMIARLTSGQFLLSTPQKHFEQPDLTLEGESKEAALAHFRDMPASEKRACMSMILDLADKFNHSQECMRFYTYVDRCDRLRGIRDLPEYDGIVPLDLATYLNFFENLYLLIVTETLSLAIIDDTYRFRFFAGCNNQLMQESELLPLGHQYPNILALYDLWREMIRQNSESDTPRASISEEICLYERDLHITRKCYQLANDLSREQHIAFINRRFQKLEIDVGLLDVSSLESSLSLQAEVVDGISENERLNIFESLTEAEMEYSLKKDKCFGFFSDGVLVGQLNVILNPTPEQDVLHDVRDVVPQKLSRIGLIDCVLVAERCRGFGLQRCMLLIARFLGRRFRLQALMAVVSPHNTNSARNFMLEGYHMIANRPKYHSNRDYYLIELPVSEQQTL